MKEEKTGARCDHSNRRKRNGKEKEKNRPGPYQLQPREGKERDRLKKEGKSLSLSDQLCGKKEGAYARFALNLSKKKKEGKGKRIG